MPQIQLQSNTKKRNSNPDFDTEIACFTPRQMEAITHLDSGDIKFLLYGGALGGGKSYFLRWYAIRRLLILYEVFGVKQPVGMLACEDYPSLKDRQLQKIAREVPIWLGRMHADHKDYGRCLILNKRWGGGIVCFRNLDDPSKYASAEFAFILVDELTKNDYKVFTHVRTRMRWPGVPDIECQFVAGTNPGSVGHGWVKQLWMDKLFSDEWVKPIDYRSQFAYVPSLADDNPHLGEDYWAMLNTLPLNLRKAFRYGDWDVFLGQAFPEFSKEVHVIKPVDVPLNAPIYMTFDWGWGHPFSIGWWWVDSDGRVYRFNEWYGWNGTANEGLRITDSEISRGIIEREKAYGQELIWQDTIRLAGHDCFQKRPDYKGGGQGPPTSEVFGASGIYLIVGDSTRHLKVRQFRERLRIQDDGLPMMFVYNTCENFIRTIPNITMDEKNVEDVNTDTEDHCYDEACHICMARPLAMEKPKEKLSSYDKRILSLYRGDKDSYTEYAEREQMRTMNDLERDFEFGDMDEYEDGGDDGDLVDTTF